MPGVPVLSLSAIGCLGSGLPSGPYGRVWRSLICGNRANVPATVTHRSLLGGPVALPGIDFSDLLSAAETG